MKAPPTVRYEEAPPARTTRPPADTEDADASDVEESVDDDEILSSASEELDDEADADSSDEEGSTPKITTEAAVEIVQNGVTSDQPRKRKRKVAEDDLEGRYMQKLAKEEEKEEEERQAERRLKRQRVVAADAEALDNSEVLEDGSNAEESVDEDSDNEGSGNGISSTPRQAPSDVPVHESLAPNRDETELEKANRTVFLANVSTSVITSKGDEKILLRHMASFFDEMPPPLDGRPKPKVESIRYRSTAYAGSALPKKAAFAKKDVMDATTKSTNAYVVYSNAYAARAAVKRLNATMVLDRHLRVDGVAHPAKTDHKRCVFVGNLGFVDDESMMDEGDENSRKRSKIPSDIEEGLWRQFGKAGKVESVRVVRDEKTRVGKGFAYVQFEVSLRYAVALHQANALQDANSVEAALLFHEKKYPPMLPRVLRVTRAKSINKTASAMRGRDPRTMSKPRDNGKDGNPNKERIYNPKVTAAHQSMEGRAGKLLGRAGAAQFKKREDGVRPQQIPAGITKTPESIVFEGYRASAKNGRPKDLKMKGGGKAKGKPKTKSARRATAWKSKAK